LLHLKKNVRFVKSFQMKDRIKQIIDLEDLSHSDFAKMLGVQRATISHILAGRNNPSVDFIQKLLQKFTNINADWLLLGIGTMYKTTPNDLFQSNKKAENVTKKQENLQNETNNQKLEDNNQQEINNTQNTIFENKHVTNDKQTLNLNNSQNIVQVSTDQIIILYDDSTFRTYTKR